MPTLISPHNVAKKKIDDSKILLAITDLHVVFILVVFQYLSFLSILAFNNSSVAKDDIFSSKELPNNLLIFPSSTKVIFNAFVHAGQGSSAC